MDEESHQPEATIGELAEGRYLLRRQLGAGGMATVYEAWDSRLKVTRAIKLLNPALTDSQSVKLRFEREAQTMAQLRHAGIVTVYDVVQDGGRVFIVMELLQGSLTDLVRKEGALLPGRCCELADRVLAALAYAHDKGVIHRDIKPHNILLDEVGDPKVTDFGIARVLHQDQSLTRTGAVLGTWSYMAPELRVDAKKASPASDIYAVGTVLYVLLTAAEPFDLYASNLHEEHFGGLPAGLRAVLVEATRYHPERRYQSADQMRQALTAALAEADDSGERPAGSQGTVPEGDGETFSLDTTADLGLQDGGAGLAAEAAEPSPQRDLAPVLEEPSDGESSAGDLQEDEPSAEASPPSYGTISKGAELPARPGGRAWKRVLLVLFALTLLCAGLGSLGWSFKRYLASPLARKLRALRSSLQEGGEADVTSSSGSASSAETSTSSSQKTVSVSKSVDEAEEEEELQTGPLSVRLSDQTFVSSVEVVCPSGFRMRGLVGEERSVSFADVPVEDCTLHFKGAATQFSPVSGGDDISCRFELPTAICE